MFHLFRKKSALPIPTKAEPEIKIGAIYVEREHAANPFRECGVCPVEMKAGYVRYLTATKLLGKWEVVPNTDRSCTVERFHHRVVFYTTLPA